MNGRDRRLFPLVLNAIGMAVVAYAFVAGRYGHRHPWLIAATFVVLAAWAVMEVLQLRVGTDEPYSPAVRWTRRAVVFTGVIVASLTQAPSGGTHVAPLAIVLILAISDEQETIWVGAAAAALSFALTPIGLLIAGANAPTAIGFLAANAIWVLIGISRRQARAATRRNRELLAQQQAAHEQQARATALAARQAAARDIHDVLAHSLGGLVIQLDAVEALLDSGRTQDAATRVAQARNLAADGLADARRAVAALRSPDETDASEQAPADLAGAAERLFRAHRELGGRIDAHLDLGAVPAPLPPRVATAFERALQEALSNARRHAPGAPVAAELVAADGRIELTVSNAVVSDPVVSLSSPARTGEAPALGARSQSSAGGGHGLVGMAERFAALDGGEASATERGGRFVVSASARVARG